MINFNEVFDHAEATTPFDQLIAVLDTAKRSVKAERNRLQADAALETKFRDAAKQVAALQPLMADDPSMIPAFMEAAATMKQANNSRISREEKTESQWPDINQCWSRAETLLLELTDTNEDVAQAA
jgi:arginine/lysine/ornithine decarboxylase